MSGDYFDVLPLGEGRLGLCIADVSGKGITAALLMANLQASVKAFAPEAYSPAVLCAKLNSVLCDTVAPGKFVTLFTGSSTRNSDSYIMKMRAIACLCWCMPMARS